MEGGDAKQNENQKHLFEWRVDLIDNQAYAITLAALVLYTLATWCHVCL